MMLPIEGVAYTRAPGLRVARSLFDADVISSTAASKLSALALEGVL